MKVSLRKINTISFKDDTLKDDSRKLVVWWYGPVVKNHRAQSVPLVIIFLRELDEHGTLGGIIPKQVALTHLGLLRIGSIWIKGVSNSKIEYQTENFDLSFSPENWKIISPFDAIHVEQRSNPIPQSGYKIPYTADKNYLIDFALPNGRNLLIPCTEFFIRFYGRSAEVKRTLATYPWSEVQSRLFKPFDAPVTPNTWPVKLAKRMNNGDTVFLAHVLHNPYANRAARNVYAQIESAFCSKPDMAFLKITPWFLGKAQLRVTGVPLNDGKTFLGLNIIGGSSPIGEQIIRDRENSNKTNGSPDGETGGLPDSSFPERKLRRQLVILNLTEDDEPDHGASSIQIEEDDFIELGDPPCVIDVRGDKKYRGTTTTTQGDESSFSTGEAHGSGKGVGHASIHARAVMESQGVLRDMWNAVRFFQKNQPDLIESADWYTFEDGYNNDPEPKLITLEGFATDTKIDNLTRKWLYYDVDNLIPRGALIMRIMVSGEPIFIFEIQRRPITKKDDEGKVKDAEEAFKGLVFTLDNQQALSPWLRLLLSDARHVRGVVQQLTGKCPGVAFAFKHTPAKDEPVSCAAAVKNALGKAGVKFGRSSERKSTDGGDIA